MTAYRDGTYYAANRTRVLERDKALRASRPLRECWRSMVKRCTNLNDPGFHRYGGRGITVCTEWQGPGGFERFLAHVGPRPSPEHSIDRIDNDRGYMPGNVRWATSCAQARNRRSSLLLTHAGKTQTATEWAEELGLPRALIYTRLRAGWPTEEVLTRPVGVALRRLGRPRRSA